MTLTNPTDEQLNVAFAEKVAGWTWTRTHKEIPNFDMERWAWYNGGVFVAQPYEDHARFAQSVDAVLPYVSKLKEVGIHYADGDWFVRLWSEDKNCANCESLAKACVIAMLRTKGVEVEFT